MYWAIELIVQVCTMCYQDVYLVLLGYWAADTFYQDVNYELSCPGRNFTVSRPQVAVIKGQGHWNVSLLLPEKTVNLCLFDLAS